MKIKAINILFIYSLFFLIKFYNMNFENCDVDLFVVCLYS